MNDDDIMLRTVSNKLNLIAALLMKAQDDGEQKRSDQVAWLNGFNLSNGEIAAILGVNKHAVEVAQTRLKKRKE